MADDILQVLTRFHREVFMPDMTRLLEETVAAFERHLRDDIRAWQEKARTIEARLEE